MSKENKEIDNTMEKIISLCKRRGFIYPGSEIYGGLAGTYDYGPNGVALKNNIKKIWWKRFVEDRDDMYGIDAAILMNQSVWIASGHVGGFSDPLSECSKCKHRFRTDQLSDESVCPDCGGALASSKQFNMMFQTNVGAVQDETSVSYLRPETAGGMFVNFKNVLDTFSPKLPFGLAQIGKAFRNEIAPRDFIFRVREFEQMEIEYFVKSEDWEKSFEELRLEMHSFMNDVGIDKTLVSELAVSEEDRAFYSKKTTDFEFEYPFGKKELYGLAYRTDYDLNAHQAGSKKDLTYFDEETRERFLPHVVEPSFGLDRTILAVLCSAYKEEKISDDDTRVYLDLPFTVAPYKVCVSPLLKNKEELQSKAREVYAILKKEFGFVIYDDGGNIGKRYRKQDEIGTPYCVVIDFDTIGTGDSINPDFKDMVTVRDRNTGEQERVSTEKLVEYIKNK